MWGVDLVVLDMAGTTVRDLGEVSQCFMEAAHETKIETTPERVLGMMGWSKRLVFETLLKEQLGPDNPELSSRIEQSYQSFCRILENYYETHPVEPTEGCLECFARLKGHNVPIALTTGFYRKVTNIILRKLGWDALLDDRYVGKPGSIIQASITSDEVPRGRPAPYMIFRAMELLGVEDITRVVNVGDTPSDLLSGRNSGCGLSLGVTNGTHTREQLSLYPNDGLLSSLV